MDEKYQGKCHRHFLLFQPQPQFDNNCPACYWEGQAAKERNFAEALQKKDGPVYIKNVGDGTFKKNDNYS